MKKTLLFVLILSTAACGTIGIGTNHEVNIHNNSGHIVTATGDHGTTEIAPGTSANIWGKHPIHLTDESGKYDPQIIDTETNIPAMLLNIIPGAIISWLPYFIDAVTGGISNLPEEYNYTV